MKNLKPKGFTLIELLTTIFIIAILATIVIVSTTYLRSKARDGKRIDDIDNIAKVLESYYADNHGYPSADCSSGECYPANKTNWVNMMTSLKGADYISECLQDEKIDLENKCETYSSSSSWGYRYFTTGTPAGSYTMITALETDKNATGTIPSGGCSQGLPSGPEYRIKDGAPQPAPC